MSSSARPLETICAGCGHEAEVTAIPLRRRGRGHVGNGCTECPCPAYRTEEQQEAWDRASGLIARIKMADNSRAKASLRASLQVAVERLLELYP